MIPDSLSVEGAGAETGAKDMADDQMAEILPPLDAAAVLERLRVMRGADAETLYRAVALYGAIAGALRSAIDEVLENPKLPEVSGAPVDEPVDDADDEPVDDIDDEPVDDIDDEPVDDIDDELVDDADDELLDVTEAVDNLAFWGVHIAAAARDTSCFTRVLRLLSLDDEAREAFWGDADTHNSAALIASTYNGDVDALLAFITSPNCDPFLGWSALVALAFLTWDKRIDRVTTEAFLRRCFDERLFEAEDPRWYAWMVATGLLGMADIEPAVRTAFDESLIDISMCDFDDWQSRIAEAAERPDDIARFAADDAGYLTDIYDALAWIAEPEADIGEEIDDIEEDLAWLEEARNRAAGSDGPIRNPLRNVGRNDPCPCGTGKKYKKCCL